MRPERRSKYMRAVMSEARRHARELRTIPVSEWADAEARHRARIHRAWHPQTKRPYPIEMVAPHLPTIHKRDQKLGTAATIALLLDRPSMRNVYISGWLNEQEADELAMILGHHPVNIWGDLWWDDVDFDLEGAA